MFIYSLYPLDKKIKPTTFLLVLISSEDCISWLCAADRLPPLGEGWDGGLRSRKEFLYFFCAFFPFAPHVRGETKLFARNLCLCVKLHCRITVTTPSLFHLIICEGCAGLLSSWRQLTMWSTETLIVSRI